MAYHDLIPQERLSQEAYSLNDEDAELVLKFIDRLLRDEPEEFTPEELAEIQELSDNINKDDLVSFGEVKKRLGLPQEKELMAV